MAKYNNVKIDGYDSKKEYRRAKELKLLEKKGIITGLQEQVKYELISPQYHFYEAQGARNSSSSASEYLVFSAIILQF